MQLQLLASGRMSLREGPRPHDIQVPKDHRLLEVAYCGVCRTDAKMWRDGHRDLALPRVLGHEIVARDPLTAELFIIWPGQVCTVCSYCRDGRDNLCEQMRIIGFHSDGGFAARVVVPQESMIPVAAGTDAFLYTFAEPLASLLNSFSKLTIRQDDRAIVYGGGLLGMLAAMLLVRQGCAVTVIEQNEAKIGRLTDYGTRIGCTIVKETVAADFDLAVNCCDSHIAFAACITKLKKGGQLAFFSGLTKNEELETNLLNLIHYKELELVGSYGPRRVDMAAAAELCSLLHHNLAMLVEEVIPLARVEAVLPKVLGAESLKFIVDVQRPVGERDTAVAKQVSFSEARASGPRVDRLARLVGDIKPLPAAFRDRAQYKVDSKTKPLGALGRLEKLAVNLATIQKSLMPEVTCRRMFVFAGDHGVVEEGVSAFPARVTQQMVDNFLAGGAAINVFCRQYNIELRVIDMGVKGDLNSDTALIDRKIARGTRNFALTRAMSRKQAIQAIEVGAAVFVDTHANRRCSLVGLGEMGIGNSSSAAAVICAATGLSPEKVVGRGTGVDDRGLQRKREVIEKALALHRPPQDDPLEILSMLGGFELGGICGAVLAAAGSGCAVVLDGVISTAAGMLAYLFCPQVKDYLIAGHRSVEIGQQAALQLMDLEPVIDLDMRLGEGTGAAITMNLVDLACRMMREMASFEEAGVDGKGVAS